MNRLFTSLTAGLRRAFVHLPTAALAAVLVVPASVHAHGDHDTPAAPAVAAAPRVEAHSELFELVGIVEGGAMRIYLDRYASNEPVKGAAIEIEASSSTQPPTVIKSKAVPGEDGTYSWKEPALERPADWLITFTVAAGNESDLLSGELRAAGEEASHEHSRWETLARPVGLALAALLAALATLVVWRRRRRSGAGRVAMVSPMPVAGAVLALGLLAAAQPQPVWAGGDHEAPAPAAGGNAPKRQSDGSVFIPKPSQRQLEVRTQPAKVGEVARTLELNGRVVMDPSAGGRVQASQGGRVEAQVDGLPVLGQPVRRGQVLAVVRPVVAPIEQANQATAAAEARINLENARKRLTRLEQLEGTVPQRDLDTARAEVAALAERATLSRVSLSAVETLVAPVSGVVAAINVVAGQVVAPNEVLFEVVDPARLIVEALAYDAAAVAKLEREAATSVGGVAVPLSLQGVGRVLREQALPVQFRVVADKGTPVLALGQPLVVKARSAERIKAVALPATALVKNPSNQDIVWVHTGAEVFVPKVVAWQAVDGATVAVTQGLAEGNRVVVRGASLVNQVR